MQQLKNYGVDGIRWDAAKHIGLSSEGCNFWNTVIDRSMYNYGEMLVGASDQHEVNQRTSDNINKMKGYASYVSGTDSCYGTDILNAIKSPYFLTASLCLVQIFSICLFLYLTGV